MEVKTTLNDKDKTENYAEENKGMEDKTSVGGCSHRIPGLDFLP